MLRILGVVLAATGVAVLITLTAASILGTPFCSYVGTHYSNYFSLQNGTYISVSASELQVMAIEGFKYYYRPRLVAEGVLHCYAATTYQVFVVNLTLQGGKAYLLKPSERALVEPLLHSASTLLFDNVTEILEKKAVAKVGLIENQAYTAGIYQPGVKLYEASLEVQPGAYYVVTLLMGKADQLPLNCTRPMQGYFWQEEAVCKVISPTPAQIVRSSAISALGVLLLIYDLKMEEESLSRWINPAIGILGKAKRKVKSLKQRKSTS